jgi:hypothetical protein
MIDRAPPDELLNFLSEYDLSVGELALALREMVLREAPSANEMVFKSYALAVNYSLTDRWTDGFCYIGVSRRHVNLGLNRGAELPDPKGLLIGDGKIMRHLKIRTPDDLNQAHVRGFIKAALKHSKSILSSKPPRRPSRSGGKSAASRSRRK